MGEKLNASLDFIRWYERGGHLDPEAETQHPGLVEVWKSLGGGGDELELSDGTVIRRSRAPEDPAVARGDEKPQGLTTEKAAPVTKSSTGRAPRTTIRS